MSVVRSNHCVYDNHYHVVFPVKYRKALISENVRQAILEIAEGIQDRYEIAFEKIGSDKDHLHILCSFHPRYAISQVVGTFKSIVAKQLFRQFPKLRQELWGGELWSDGYYVATVSERGNWQEVKNYVERQGKATGQTSQLTLWK